MRQCAGACPSVSNSFTGASSTATVALVDEVLHNNGGGSFSQVADPLGNVVSMTYDILGRRTQLKDPDLGLVTDVYDAAGRHRQSQSAVERALSQSTTMVFDALDRMTSRLAPDENEVWDYDSVAHGVGALGDEHTVVTATGATDFMRAFTYDALARPSTVTMSGYPGGVTYTTTTTYDAWSRPLALQAQRSGSAAKTFTTGYNGMGFAQTLTNGAGLVLWTSTGVDAADRELTANYGNATNAIRVYDPHTTHLYTSLLSSNANGQSRFQEVNTYDVLDNMLTRTGQWDTGLSDANKYSDVFTYDALNRVQTAQAWSQLAETFNYNAIGNITSKTSTANGGTYNYPASGPTSVGPHAVQSINGLGSYVYDADGNMTSAPNSASSQWTSFDMPVKVTKGSAWDGFIYGPNRERIRMTRSDGSTTYYAGPMEAMVDASGKLTLKTYWPQGLGVDIDKPDGTTSQYWTPHDRLGSVMAYIDATGAVVEQLDYDAWGRRRNANGVGIPDTLAGKTDDKGFTGQQMLDNVNLVHLNGRIYDPLIGRFLSADPVVQAPENSQSYNRYTYVWNNPTNMTDPTGFEGQSEGSSCDAACQRRDNLHNGRPAGASTMLWGSAQIAQHYDTDQHTAASNTATNVGTPQGTNKPVDRPSEAKGAPYKEEVINSAADARQSIAAGLGNSIAKNLTLGANWLIAAFGDDSAPLLETGRPFTPKSDFFGEKGEAIGDGLQAVAGARAFGQAGASVYEAATAIATKEALSAINVGGRIRESGMGLAEAGRFFGWKGDGGMTKPLSEFSRESLEAAGWTRETIENTARGYREIAHTTPNNVSARPRAEQLEALAKLWK